MKPALGTGEIYTTNLGPFLLPIFCHRAVCQAFSRFTPLGTIARIPMRWMDNYTGPLIVKGECFINNKNGPFGNTVIGNACIVRNGKDLLKCIKHTEPRLISGHGSQGRYVCSRDYSAGNGPVCLDISKRYLDEPLEDAVLSQLLISAQGEKVLMRMEAEAREGRLKDTKSKHEITRLEQELTRWQSLLASCVDETTGRIDKEKETLYWDKIHSVQKQIEGLRSRQAISTGPGVPDFQMVREFMAGLQDGWPSYSSTLRNRFLKCLIDRVEIMGGDKEIEATIFWKAGFQQKIVIQRGIRKVQDKPWSETEIHTLKKLYPSSSFDDVIAALPGRSWHGIVNKAQRLHLQRDQKRRSAPTYRLWSAEDDMKLEIEYENGKSVAVIASNLGRSINAIQVRAAKMNLERDKSLVMQKRKDNKPVLFQESSP